MAQNQQELALRAAAVGEALVTATRQANADLLERLLAPGSAARLSYELFGATLFRLLLRLDDPQEEEKLAPYDLQIEGEIALLELGVVTALPSDENNGRAHLLRLFGSGVLLRYAPENAAVWLVEEIFPVNADGNLRPDDPTDARILAVVQGRENLPLQTERLDAVERFFLAKMQAGRFNLEELYNAVRLWRDYKTLPETENNPPNAAQWAGAIEYLITVFDYHDANENEIAASYGVTPEDVTSRAREIAFNLRATQFDDRYTIHPDPVEHYRELFGELGINPERDEKVRQASLNKVFDYVEVPPDDDTFFGPQ
jgi:hypothetical protein